MLEQAVAYARGHGIGPKRTLRTRLFPAVTRAKLEYALAGNNKRLEQARKATDVLTIEWIKLSVGVGQLIPRALGINLMGFNAKIHVSLVINLRFNSRFNSI